MSEYTHDNNKTWFDNPLIKSKAWENLSATAHTVLLSFYMKRKMKKRKVAGRTQWFCLNCDELTFTYSEAEKLRIKRRTFTNAIDNLIATGFIVIVRHGGGLEQLKTVYALSDMWKKYGTDEFKPQPKQKSKAGYCRTPGRGRQDV